MYTLHNFCKLQAVSEERTEALSTQLLHASSSHEAAVSRLNNELRGVLQELRDSQVLVLPLLILYFYCVNVDPGILFVMKRVKVIEYLLVVNTSNVKQGVVEELNKECERLYGKVNVNEVTMENLLDERKLLQKRCTIRRYHSNTHL